MKEFAEGKLTITTDIAFDDEEFARNILDELRIRINCTLCDFPMLFKNLKVEVIEGE